MALNHLEGAKEFDRLLLQLRDGLAPKLIRQSLAEAMKPTLALARASVPEATEPHRTYLGRLVAPGFLRRSLRISSRVRRDKSSAQADITSGNKEAFYGMFIEYGVPAHGIPARPWLVPAFLATRDIAVANLMAALKKRLASAIAKGGRR